MIRRFGKIIPGLKLYGEEATYPVLNERDARAAAGIMFVFGVIAFSLALLAQNFLFLKFFVVLFTFEFAVRVLINPYLAPLYSLGTFLVQNQQPEYSGAVQKKFAWSLGLGLAGIMMIVVFVFQIRGVVPFTICLTCLILLWLETSLGVCIGCKMYQGLIDLNILNKPKVKPACPGGVCKI